MNRKALNEFRERLRADRLKRRLTWQAYAILLGVSQSTLNKIVQSVTDQPHELTVAKITDRLDQLAAEDAAALLESILPKA